jgi:ABC-type amino acid transport substrate-binding protein
VGLWSGEPFSYDGEFYTLEDAELHLTPVQQPRIPIVMGCWWPNRKPFQRAARWDGVMPWAPSFQGSEGLQGEPVTGTPEEELREMMAYFDGLTDDPGEVILPIDPPEAPADFAEVCKEVGATWLLTTDLLEDDTHEGNLERIREGPPR